MVFDPTRTTRLRISLRAAAMRRVQTLLRVTRIAVVDQNMLGLSGPNDTFQSQHLFRSAPLDNEQKLRAFGTWFEGAIYNTLVMEGRWLFPFLEQAYATGVKASREFVQYHPGQQMDGLFREHAVRELSGIADATVQAATRVAALRIRTDDMARKMYLHISAQVRKTTKNRLDALCNVLVVQVHNSARIDHFRMAGVRLVGVIPERVPAKVLHDHFNDARRRTRTRTRRREPPALVNILTAGDDNVCQTCEDLAEDGPYTLEEASELFPVHIRCRCVFVPADDRRYAEPDDDFDHAMDYDPNQPRDPDGKWAGGGLSERIQSAVADVKSFVEGKSAIEVIKAAAKSHAAAEAASMSLQTLVSHGLGMDASTWHLNEQVIDYTIRNAASIASITRSQAKDLLSQVVKGLIALRKRGVKDSKDEDLVLKWLQALDRSIDDYEPQEYSHDGYNPNQPREPKGSPEGGQFAGGNASVAPGAFVGQYITTGPTPIANHAMTVARVISRPPQRGIHYRRLVTYLIREAPQFHGESAIPILQQKLEQAMQLTAANLQLRGRSADAQRASAVANKVHQGSGLSRAAHFAAPAQAESLSQESIQRIVARERRTSKEQVVQNEQASSELSARLETTQTPITKSVLEEKLKKYQTSANVMKAFEKHVKKDPDEFVSRMLGPMLKHVSLADGALRIKITSYFGDNVRLSSEFAYTNPSGQIEIGRMHRSLDFDKKEAEHEYLMIPDSLRNNGKALLDSQVALYKQLGMETVKVHANIDVGSYAWAKYGFVPTQASWNDLRLNLRLRLRESSVSHGAREKDIGEIRELLRKDDPKTLWKVVDHLGTVTSGGKSTTIAKVLLTGGSAPDWYGTLAFKDKESMERFDAYVKKT